MEANNNDQNAQRAGDHQNQNQPHQQEHSAQDVSASNDQLGENSEQTPLADAVTEDESEKSTLGSEGGSGWNNNKPGATNEEKDSNLIPTSDPENYTS
jgi:hypothetical protein